MSAEARRRWGWVAGAVMLLSAAFLLTRLDRTVVLGALGRADRTHLCAAALVNAGTIALQSFRWRALLRARAPVRRSEAFAALVYGLWLSAVLPARLGELVRIRVVTLRTALPSATVVGSILVDHLVNAAALLPFIAPLLAVGALPASWHRGLLVALVGLCVLAGGAWAVSAHRGHRPQGATARLLIQLREGASALRSRRRIGAALGWGVVAWCGEIATMWLSLEAFGLALSWSGLLLTLLVLNAALLIPAPPANLGTFEAGTTLALGLSGVDAEPALAFALGYHAVHLATIAALMAATWTATRRWGV
jgi:uncharacterized membrane protein YbhN (UPF0104 family)